MRIPNRDDKSLDSDWMYRCPNPIQLVIGFESDLNPIPSDPIANQIWIGINLDVIGYNSFIHFYPIFAQFVLSNLVFAHL